MRLELGLEMLVLNINGEILMILIFFNWLSIKYDYYLLKCLFSIFSVKEDMILF